MAKDPAVLWYWSDWNSGTTTLSRFLKGCYMDLLHAQFNNGRLSISEIKTVLGTDFGQAWPTLQKKFKQDEKGAYYNERLEVEKIKRQKFVESRSKNLTSSGKSPHMVSHMNRHMGNRMGDHMENENEDRSVNEFKEGGAGETIHSGIVPDMVKQFLEASPEYFVDQSSDYSAVREIAGKILKWQKLGGQIIDRINAEKIKTRWGEIINHIQSDTHYRTYSIEQINKYFQRIIQSLTTSKHATGSNRVSPAGGGKSAGANAVVEKLTAKLNSRGESGIGG